MNTFIDRVNAIVQSNQASMAQNVSYPDAGMGALENVANNVPRQADLMNQPQACDRDGGRHWERPKIRFRRS